MTTSVTRNHQPNSN